MLLAQKADPFLPKGHKNALAKAVDSNYDDAAKILFERMKHVLISKGSERTLQVAFSSFLDFEPFDLFKPMAENFVLTPGKTLLNLVHLARNCRRATKLMKTANTEVMRKYEQVAQQCPLVMHALLQTLDVSQLFSLFFETQHGSALLLEMVSFDMEGDMDDVLASEEVYVIIDKRWNGRLWRTITRRNARDGSYLPIWKAVVFFCVFFFYALPLNLAILPLCVMFPPFKSWVKNRISEDDGSGSSGGGHGKGRTGVGGVQRSRSRRDSLLDFFGSEASRKKRGSNAEPSEARYYGDAAPGIGWLKPLLGITISRKGLYLLETPGICLTIYIAAQLVFTALFIAVELPTNGNLNPAPQLRFVLMFWAASNAWLGVEGLLTDFTSWQADWLNLFELPGTMISFCSLFSSFVFRYDDEARHSYYYQQDRYGESLRAVAVCILLVLQGLRALQMSSTVGPLILMLKFMLLDFLIWVCIAGVCTVAFSVAIWQTFQYDAGDYTQDDCEIHGYFDESVVQTIPRLMTAYFGGGEDYVQCFARASESGDYTASVLIFVYLVLAVVILMNMLIAMMAKTFDKVHEHYTRNYKVMKVKLFVAYLRRDLAHSAPFVLFGFPFFLYTWGCNLLAKLRKRWKEREGRDKEGWAEVAVDAAHQLFSETTSVLQLLSETYPNWYDESMKHSFPDIDSIVPTRLDRTGGINEDGGDQGTSGMQVSKWESSVSEEKPVNRAVLPPKTLQWIAKVHRLYKAAYPEDEAHTADDIEVVGKEVMRQFEMHIKNTLKMGTDQELEFETLLVQQRQMVVNQDKLADAIGALTQEVRVLGEHKMPPATLPKPSLPPVAESQASKVLAAPAVA